MGKEPLYPLKRRLHGPRSSLDVLEQRQISTDYSAHYLATILTIPLWPPAAW